MKLIGKGKSVSVVLTWVLVCSAMLVPGFKGAAFGQDKPATDQTTPQNGQASPEQDPLQRKLTGKQKERSNRQRMKELGDEDRRWLEQDVKYIISDEEREAFLQLSNSQEREQFIEQFWLRRDPTPDTPENEFKEEHYRRIAYANDHFASGAPGWRTDRGRIYIAFGPPDEIESHAGGGTYLREANEGGGSTTTYPFERWRYRYLEGVDQNVIIEFVDRCECNEYKLTMNPNDKDALLMQPGAGQTIYEQMGIRNKSDRVWGFSDNASPIGDMTDQSKQFDRLQLWAKLMRPPAIKFKDLDEVVSHRISYNLVPFEVRADYVKVTSDTALVPVTIQIQNRDITFVAKDGIMRGTVNIFGRVSTMTGRVVQTFEDVVQIDVPNDLLEKKAAQASVYWKAFPLRAGTYRLSVVLKDVNSDRMGTYDRSVTAPNFGDDKLASSSMILADVLERVPTKSVGAGSFILGDRKVRPRMESAQGKPAAFKRDQRLNMWMQVYNLGIDEKTKKPSATVEYDLVNAQTNQELLKLSESTEEMGNVGQQLTLEKSMALNTVQPGMYRLTVKVEDKIANQTLTRTTPFQVE